MELAIRYEIHTYSGGLGVSGGGHRALRRGPRHADGVRAARQPRRLFSPDHQPRQMAGRAARLVGAGRLVHAAGDDRHRRDRGPAGGDPPMALRPDRRDRPSGSDPAARHRPRTEQRDRPDPHASPLRRRRRLSPQAGNHSRHRRGPGAAGARLQHPDLAYERGSRGAADPRPPRRRAGDDRHGRPRRNAQAVRVHHAHAGRGRTGSLSLRPLRPDRARVGAAGHRQGTRRVGRPQHDAAGAQPLRLFQRGGRAARGNIAADVPGSRRSMR